MSSSVLLFPGQGAQSIGMGRAWHAASGAGRDVFTEADAVFADATRAISELNSRTLSQLCFEGPGELLNRTDVSQPAIYTASIASLRALTAAGSLENPVAAAGLSLGEYTALCAAGAFSFADGLRLVCLRGRAMQDAAEASSGGMVALIGADEGQAQEVCRETLLTGDGREVLVCANFNAPGQIVISGSKSACERAAAADGPAARLGLRATVLQVAGAFHSPLMQPAADRLKAALAGTAINANLACTVVANVTAEPHAPSGDSIRTRLFEQLTAPVRWAESCAWLAKNHASATFHELAPGKTLMGLMRRIDKSIKVTPHDEPA
ncbi:ACP S-malonyltransferase [soil metagenome]